MRLQLCLTMTEKSLRTFWYMGVLHLLKDGCDQFCLHSFALVGIETIKKLLTLSSPFIFTAEATVKPDHFIEADIKMLLDELESADITTETIGCMSDISLDTEAWLLLRV